MPIERLKATLADLGYRYDKFVEGGPSHVYPGNEPSASMGTHLFFKPLSEFGPAPHLLAEINSQLEEARRGSVSHSAQVRAFCLAATGKALEDARKAKAEYATHTGYSVNAQADVVFHQKSGTPGVLLKLSVGNARVKVARN